MEQIKTFNGSVNTRLLAVYNWLVYELGFSPADVNLYILRTFVTLTSGTTFYKIPLCAKFNELTADKTQKQIGQNDAFAPVAASMVVRKAIGSNYAVAEQATFEDKTIFNAASGGSGFTENQNIQGVYFGASVTLDVENDAIIENLSGVGLRYVPTIQAAAAAVAGFGSNQDFDRFLPLYKDIVVAGGTDASLKVSLQGFTPDAKIVGDSGVSGEQNYLGFEVVGFHIKGEDNRVMDLSRGQKCVIR